MKKVLFFTFNILKFLFGSITFRNGLLIYKIIKITKKLKKRCHVVSGHMISITLERNSILIIVVPKPHALFMDIHVVVVIIEKLHIFSYVFLLGIL